MAQRGLPNSKEALLKGYNIRLKDDVKSMQENFEGEIKKAEFPSLILKSVLEILKLAKGDHDTQLSKNTQSEQDTYEMQVRAANIGEICLH